MRAFRFAVLTAVVFAAGQVPTASLGGGEGGDGGYGGAAASHGLSSATTRSVVRTLTRGASRCGSQPWIYRYDCYRWVYKRAADQLTGNPAYSEAHKAMLQVERSLEAAVNKNRDPSKPVRRRALETYKPIKSSAIPAVKRAADKALNQGRDPPAALCVQQTRALCPHRAGCEFQQGSAAINPDARRNDTLCQRHFGALNLTGPFGPA
ncbi:hypothetical protein [Pseudophaeobacter leonis]|uniref:hypothetical protein n=1 Tax=Pseudophaeobacter leonis TaxID=1144477 RepID=UPI001F4EF298|nr:hypothetical protein [Pseudophaeobacter leonis]